MATNTVSSPTQPSPADLEAQVSRDTSQLERHGFLFGQKITHSLSPFLHNVIYQDLGLNWGQIRLDSADMALFLKLIRHPSFYGASVTMPNKVAIIPHLDKLTDECRDIGACNTIYTTPDPADPSRRLFCGTNTDVVGIRESFYQNITNPDAVFHNRPALVVGGGGAARSAVYALRRWMRVSTIYLVNRDAAEVDAVMRDCAARGYGSDLVHLATLEQAATIPQGPGAIVACVPDFEPRTAEEKLARDITLRILEGAFKGAMLEMCYNPTPFTRLGALAEERGWKVILGTEALVWQGIEQDKYWTGKEASELPVEKVRRAIADKVSQRANAML